MLALVTSKPISYASKITEFFGASKFLDFEFGSELDGTRSDKTDLISFALSKIKIAPEDAVMVGDRSYGLQPSQHLQVLFLFYSMQN